MTDIQVGVALPRREEREAVMAALEQAGMAVESLVEACHVDSDIARQAFGCLVADGALLASGYLSSIRRRDPRVPIVALVDAAQADDVAFRRLSVVTRPCDPAEVAARVDLAYSESRQARRRVRTRTPRVPSRVKGASATILDISLDGIRLEVAQDDAAKFGPRFRLQVPMVALDVELQRVWLRKGRGDTVECGARLVTPDPSQQMAWQRIIELSSATMSLPGMQESAPRAVPAEPRLLARVSALLASSSIGGWAHHLSRVR